MRWLASLALIFAALGGSVPAQAQQQYVTVWVEQWVEVAPATRFVALPSVAVEQRAIAAYGPFRVIDGQTAALVDATDSQSPAQFSLMLRDFPRLSRLDLVECAGTSDDRANLRLGRLIRAAGLTTRVPEGGSVRSGGVELLFAGAYREVADGAEFAVHAWEDEDGRQAGDYAESAPENAKYLAYYREMGMSGEQARAFYALTNSAPYESALWLDGAQMRQWIEPAHPVMAAPTLAYLDLGLLLN